MGNLGLHMRPSTFSAHQQYIYRPTQRMLPDWVLLILLFVGIALVPLYTPSMSLRDLLTGGLGTLLHSGGYTSASDPSSGRIAGALKLTHLCVVSIFVGLIILAILLLASGVILIVGFENVRGRFTRDNTALASSHAKVDGKTLAADSDAMGTTPRSAMRPYRVAKAQHQSHNDQMIGLLLVLAGLAMLYIVPSYLFTPRSDAGNGSRVHEPPRWQEDSASREDRISSSGAGQGLLGALTLVILIGSFAMLKPEKQTKKTKDLDPQGQ